VNHNYDTVHEFYFFAGVLTTILIADVSKAFLANRLRKIITTRFLLIMNRTVAVILFAFGVRLLLFLFDKNAALELPF
jgi:threonine/homoserine/homoserine lactone efflux protein